MQHFVPQISGRADVDRIVRFAVLVVAISVISLNALAQGLPTLAASSSLPAASATVELLVPEGWMIEQRHDADFNRDGRADVLLLLRQPNEEGAVPPRMLLVALATAKQRGYLLSATNARLVPHESAGALEDPMADGEIKVRPGGFDLKLGMMPGAGSYMSSIMRYHFRLEGTCFRLTGFDRAETHRATLEIRDLSVNYLNGAVVETTGNEQSQVTQVRRKHISTRTRRCLSELGSAWTFDPLRP